MNLIIIIHILYLATFMMLESQSAGLLFFLIGLCFFQSELKRIINRRKTKMPGLWENGSWNVIAVLMNF